MSRSDSDAYDDGFIRLKPIDLPQPSLLRGSFPPYNFESAKAAREVLQRNHDGFHVFFNEMNFHNHLPHHVLAALQLGAPPNEFEAIWEHARDSLDPTWKLNKKPTRDDNIEKITRDNWTSHLGDRSFYWCYLDFFDHQVAEHGLGACLDEFIMSREANGKGRHMLARFVSGVIHPCIHTGYGAEFSIAGVAAEGLAMAAITEARHAPLFPEGEDDVLEQATASFTSSTSLDSTGGGAKAASDHASASQPREGLSVFSICALAGKDDRLAPGKAVKHSDKDMYGSLLRGEDLKRLHHFSRQWVVSQADAEDPDPLTGKGGWNEKWEELVWFNVLLMGATSRPDHTPRHDFFFMHTHNALLFLPTLLPIISLKSRRLLLQALWKVSFCYWITRGRPSFFIEQTMYQWPSHPLDPQKTVTLEGPAQGLSGPQERNAWQDILAAAVNHADEHAMKALRSLMYFATRLSHTQAGSLSLQPQTADDASEDGVFRGLDRLDGTAFVRTAAQLLARQGWRSDGGFHWDFNGPGFDETWGEGAMVGRHGVIGRPVKGTADAASDT